MKQLQTNTHLRNSVIPFKTENIKYKIKRGFTNICLWVLAPPLSSICPLWRAKPSRICHEGVGVQDLHHFLLYTFVPHRLSNPPTHALYALGACMSVPLPHKSVRAWLPKAGKHCLMTGQVSTVTFSFFYKKFLKIVY